VGRSRGGLTTKIHAAVDGRGLPIRLCITPGQVHDMQAVAYLLADLKPGAMLLADKGYDADHVRQWAQDRDAWANIPPKSNRKNPICFSPHLYKKRNLVERFFSKIKHFRAIATRYDASGGNYLAALKLVAIRIWLRYYESTT
jgi:transposase